jgi:hypothetical protein
MPQQPMPQPYAIRALNDALDNQAYPSCSLVASFSRLFYSLTHKIPYSFVLIIPATITNKQTKTLFSFLVPAVCFYSCLFTRSLLHPTCCLRPRVLESSPHPLISSCPSPKVSHPPSIEASRVLHFQKDLAYSCTNSPNHLVSPPSVSIADAHLYRASPRLSVPISVLCVPFRPSPSLCLCVVLSSSSLSIAGTCYPHTLKACLLLCFCICTQPSRHHHHHHHHHPLGLRPEATARTNIQKSFLPLARLHLGLYLYACRIIHRPLCLFSFLWVFLLSRVSGPYKL